MLEHMKCSNCGNDMVQSKAGWLCVECGHVDIMSEAEKAQHAAGAPKVPDVLGSPAPTGGSDPVADKPASPADKPAEMADKPVNPDDKPEEEPAKTVVPIIPAEPEKAPQPVAQIVNEHKTQRVKLT